jgi:hypothetical protein
VHRLFHVERRLKSEIAQRLALDRKTVRSILRRRPGRPYTRPAGTETRLAAQAEYLRGAAVSVSGPACSAAAWKVGIWFVRRTCRTRCYVQALPVPVQ